MLAEEKKINSIFSEEAIFFLSNQIYNFSYFEIN